MESFIIANQYYSSKKKKIKKGFSIFLAAFVPSVGAFFKSLTYAFGVLNFINFFYLGTIAITGAAFTGPFLPLVCFLAVGAFIVTLLIEDRSVYGTLLNKLDALLGVEAEQALASQLEDATPLPTWRRYLNNTAATIVQIAGIVLPLMISASKGLATAIAVIAPVYCCYSITMGLTISAIGVGALTALGPPGWVILTLGCLAGLAVATISLAKEGRACYALTTKTAQWLRGESATPKPRFVFPETKKLVQQESITTKERGVDPDNQNFLKWKATKWPDKPPPAKIYPFNNKREIYEEVSSTKQPAYGR